LVSRRDGVRPGWTLATTPGRLPGCANAPGRRLPPSPIDHPTYASPDGLSTARRVAARAGFTPFFRHLDPLRREDPHVELSCRAWSPDPRRLAFGAWTSTSSGPRMRG